MSEIYFELVSISENMVRFFEVFLYTYRLLRCDFVFCLQIHDIRDPDLLKKRGVTIIDVGNDKVDHKVGFCYKRAPREYSGSVVKCLTPGVSVSSLTSATVLCP